MTLHPRPGSFICPLPGMGCGDPFLLDPEPSSPTVCPVVWREGAVASVSSSWQGECGGDILAQEKETTSVAIFTGLVPLLRSVPTTMHPLPGIREVNGPSESYGLQIWDAVGLLRAIPSPVEKSLLEWEKCFSLPFRGG